MLTESVDGADIESVDGADNERVLMVLTMREC